MADFVKKKIWKLATLNSLARGVSPGNEQEAIKRDIEMMQTLVDFLDEFNALDEEKKMFNDYMNHDANKNQVTSNELDDFDENLCGEILMPQIHETAHNPYWFMNERGSKK